MAAAATVSVRRARRVFTLEQVTSSLAADASANLTLALPRKAFAAVRGALTKHRRVTAQVSVQATDAAGNASTKSVEIQLVR